MSRSTDAEFLEAASTGQSHIVTSMLADLPPPKQPVSLTRPQAAPTIPGPISSNPVHLVPSYLLRRRDNAGEQCRARVV